MNNSWRWRCLQFGLAIVLLSVFVACPTAAKSTARSSLDVWNPGLDALLATMGWDLSIGLSSESNPPLTPDEVTEYIGTSKFLREGCAKAKSLKKVYRSQLKTFTTEFSYAGGPVAYVCDDPICFSMYRGKVCLTICGVADSNVYNTLRFDFRQRASKVFDTYAVSLASSLRNIKPSGGVQYCAVTIAYGARDFSKSDSISPRSEALVIVADISLWAKLARTEITDQDFAAKADIYVSAAGSKTRRTKLKLE